jgi:hypothetical protein
VDVEYERALEALSYMRRDRDSLAHAARRAGLTPYKVKKQVGRALKKKGRYWKARAWDRLPRRMRLVDAKGLKEVEVKDSRTAEKVARYWNGVERYLRSGDRRYLKPFESLSFQSGGDTYGFLTDPAVLVVLAQAGEVAFEDLYVQGM